MFWEGVKFSGAWAPMANAISQRDMGMKLDMQNRKGTKTQSTTLLDCKA